MRPMHRAPELAHICKINDCFFLKLEALSVKVSYVRFAVLGAWYEKENDTAFDRPNHHPLGEPASNGATPVERTKAFLEMRSYCGVVGKRLHCQRGSMVKIPFISFQSDSINESSIIQLCCNRSGCTKLRSAASTMHPILLQVPSRSLTLLWAWYCWAGHGTSMLFHFSAAT